MVTLELEVHDDCSVTALMNGVVKGLNDLGFTVVPQEGGAFLITESPRPLAPEVIDHRIHVRAVRFVTPRKEAAA